MGKLKQPSKKGIIQFIIFNAGGAAFFIVGYGTFSLLYGLFHWPWLPAKIVGDGLGWAVNFIIQYFIAFREERHDHRPHVVLGKYTALSLLNLAIDYGIVALLQWLGVSPFIGMLVASQFFTVWKWVWYRRWIFSGKLENIEP